PVVKQPASNGPAIRSDTSQRKERYNLGPGGTRGAGWTGAASGVGAAEVFGDGGDALEHGLGGVEEDRAIGLGEALGVHLGLERAPDVALALAVGVEVADAGVAGE